MVNYDFFLNFIQKHCTNYKLDGNEIKINSLFCEDDKLHLWCNPSKNAYHCWKTNKSGNLCELVMQLGGYSYQEAMSLLTDDNELRKLEEKLDKFFAEKEEKKITKITSLNIPENTFYIKDITGHYRERAEKYLKTRYLPISNLMMCIGGDYHNRIVIPYYDKEGNLIYWNSRDLGNGKNRYLGPKNVGIGKADVLFIENWNCAKIYLTEGEFDAMSLTQCGLNSAACGGKELSDKQMQLLKSYSVCICFDTDKSGAEGLNTIGDKLIKNQMKKVSYVRPPLDSDNPNKKMDWNKFLVELGKDMVTTYIHDQEKPYTAWTSNVLRLNRR